MMMTLQHFTLRRVCFGFETKPRVFWFEWSAADDDTTTTTTTTCSCVGGCYNLVEERDAGVLDDDGDDDDDDDQRWVDHGTTTRTRKRRGEIGAGERARRTAM